ncbi:rhomboid family intramembrane serine protease [Ammonifex thiophilus]|uniref:Rhomboid family intramembrane serine protease n=1 Tax=Ammonifex thiophilus TaxID=444093 RepID=A0A3D8P4L1_9THEO|nr:rhomboid family intramembrane serine protease [Ammonifex thiophilus]
MIPLRDTIRSKHFPIVTVAIIAANLLIFLYELSLSHRELDLLVRTLGVVPARELGHLALAPFSLETYFPFLTSMFLHGGWIHVLGNMLYLWVFGDNVEDIMGHFRFLVFYLFTGFIGGLLHVWMNPDSHVPTIGASGAVAGVLGAYFVSFPHSRVLTLVPIFIFITLVELPAVLFLFLWFGLQLLSGVASLGVPGEPVAWWAHIGGFVSGAVLVHVFRRR